MANTKLAKKNRVSVSKTKLAKTADGLEEMANSAAISGTDELMHGAQRVETGEDMAAAGAVLLAKGASDVTRAADAKIVSDRMAVLSDVVAVAGVVDVAEGAEMLAASDDVDVLSALVGMMSMDDLDHGLELARLAGELHTVGDMVESLKMPVLAGFLADRAGQLHEMSIQQIRIAISTDGVSQLMAAAGEKISALGQNEVEEGVTRLAVSQAAAVESGAMAQASEELLQQGAGKMVVGAALGKAAREEVEDGALEIASGSENVGAALAMDDVAAQLKDKSK